MAAWTPCSPTRAGPPWPAASVTAGDYTDVFALNVASSQPTVTDGVVEALSRALQLDDIEGAHLANLAAPSSRRRRTGPDAAQRADPGMLRLMGALDHVPALLLGRRAEFLARNGLLTAVLGDAMEPGSSFIRWLFLDPDARERIVNWVDFAAAAVGALRYEVGRHPDDSRLLAQVQELRHGDPDVARWWDDHRVTFRTSVIKRLWHPTAGPLSFAIESVVGPHDPDQRLVVHTVEPDSATARTLPLLASWATRSDSPSGPRRRP